MKGFFTWVSQPPELREELCTADEDLVFKITCEILNRKY